MWFVASLILVLFALPPVYSLFRYFSGAANDPKPHGGEVAGVILCTAAMLAYTIFLMAHSFFF